MQDTTAPERARSENEVERHDWSDEEIQSLYDLPLPDLIFRAQTIHRRHHDPRVIQKCTLLSIKTGGCPEDCGYCSQSAHHDTGVEVERLMDVERVRKAARRARDDGSTRFCMGAAWREVRDGPEFDRVLEMVREVNSLGMEVCCTLGMLTADQAQRLQSAGLTAYNHNLDTGPDDYERIISTRTYEDRLKTLENVRTAGVQVCCGGIIGMGERVADRVAMLGVLARMASHPESVPINALMAVAGTPLEHETPADPIDMARMIATARVVMPRSRVRLSAGRTNMSETAQALCFLAGANSIFSGDKLLTTPNPGQDEDRTLVDKLGMKFVGGP